MTTSRSFASAKVTPETPPRVEDEKDDDAAVPVSSSSRETEATPPLPTGKLSLREEVVRTRERLKGDGWLVIEPNSKFMRDWDLITFCALIFTAVVTPVEV